MVFPSSTNSSDKDGGKESNKPSWAFDATKELPKTTTSLQDSYSIPYPHPPTELVEEDIPYLGTRMFLVIVNSIFFVVGFGMVIMAIIAAAKPATCAMCFAALRPLLIVGMLTSLISSLGIFGAVFNSYKMLLVYVTCVTFLLMIQLIAFFWSLFGRDNFRRRIHLYLTEKMRTRPHDLVSLLEIVQSHYECCGVNGPLDYHTAGLQIPRSCCSAAKGFDCSLSSFISTAGSTFNTSTETIMATTEATNATSNGTMHDLLELNETQLDNGNLTRRKRNASELTQEIQEDPNVASTRLDGRDLGLDSQFATNASNNSLSTTLPPALFNDTNITGGPEHWDIHHVKR